MLRLLQKKIKHEQGDFLAHLFFVGIVHLCIGIILFIGSRSESLSLTMRSARPRQAVIVWRATRTAVKKNVAQETLRKKASRTQLPDKPARSVPAKPSLEKQSLAKPLLAKQIPARPMAGNQMFSKIDLGAKKLKTKCVVQKKNDDKKHESVHRDVPDKDKSLNHIKEQVPVPTPVVSQTAASEVIHMNIHEYDKQHDMWEIVDAVQRWWQPPLGVDEGTVCVIKVAFSPSGTIQELVVQKSSGIPVYDIAAKGALLKAVFSKKVWGKEWVFHF